MTARIIPLHRQSISPAARPDSSGGDHVASAPALDGRAATKARRQPCADELLRAANDFPDLYTALRLPEPTWREELVEDWHGFIAEVRRSPYSHALVAIATVIGWTVLLVLPTVLGVFQ